MLYYFFALLAAAAVLLIGRVRSEANRWAAAFLGCASIGGLTDTLAAAGWDVPARAAEFLNLTLTPYGVLVFALVYAGRPAGGRGKRLAKGLLLLPVLLTAAVTPFAPELRPDYRLLLAWAGPYYLAACALLLHALRREADPARRRSRLVMAVIMVPTLLGVLGFIYVAKAVKPDFDFFSYVSVFIGYSLTAAALFLFAYGVLGVKLRFVRDPLESALTAAASGTAMLNHTIKNEIGKIALSAENLAHTLPASDPGSGQHLELIRRSSAHMLDMVGRLNGRLGSLSLSEAPCRLDELAAACIAAFRQQPDGGAADIRLRAACRPLVVCDAVHIREALANLLANAAEAMPDGGVVEVRLAARGRAVRLSVRDEGAGMTAEQAARAFEPFYSTKRAAHSFGLGLSYVYKVMRASGGTVELHSRVREGTTVTLVFARAKTISLLGGTPDGAD